MNVGPNVAGMPMLEMFMPYPLVTLTRFHKWDEVMKYPQPDSKMLITTAFWHFSRGLALAESGKPETGDLKAAVIARVMHDAKPSLRLCYEGELPANPKLEGKLRVYFEIGPSGAVQGQKLEESSLRNGRVEQCVLQTLAKVEFPRPPDGEAVPISYPFVFHGDPSQLPPPDEEE
jgi:hypothetical protein